MKQILLLTLASLFLCGTGRAVLAIQDADIVNNHYEYQMSFDDLANATKLNQNVYSQANISVSKTGTGSSEVRFVRANQGQTSAALIYKFDFTQTSFLPRSVSITDYVLSKKSSTLTSQWSTDGVNWTTIRSITSKKSTVTSGPGTTVIDFTSAKLPKVVYYRVTCSATVSTFYANANQWAGASPGNSSFAADFVMDVNEDVIADYGLNEHIFRYEDHLALCDQIIASGAKWVRLSPEWNSIETSKGVYDTAFLGKMDAIVDRLQAGGVNILWILAYTASWASSQPTLPWPDYSRCKPANWTDWEDFVVFVTSRYNGKIDHWEVWNEPNGAGFWKDSVADYVTLLQKASAKIWQTNPNNKVLMGGLALENGPSFLTSMLDLGAAGYFDIANYHCYLDAKGQLTTYNQINDVLTQYGLQDRPIWITENGYSSDGDSALEMVKADRMDQLNALYKNFPNVVKTFWYSFRNAETNPYNAHESNFGLSINNATAFQPLPAYYHYQARDGAASDFDIQRNNPDLASAAQTLCYVSPASGDGAYVVDDAGDKRIPAGTYMYFTINDQWLYAANGGLDTTAILEVTFLDEGTGIWALNYDSTGNAYKDLYATRTNTGQWLTQTFVLEDIYFANRENYWSDFRLRPQPGSDLVVRQVVVRRDPDAARVILKSNNAPKMMEHVVVTNPDWEAYNPVDTKGGVECRQIPAGKYSCYQVSDAFAQAGTTNLTVGITYWDEGINTFNVQYNAVGNNYKSLPIAKTNTGTWKYVAVTVTDANFTNAQNYLADFRIYAPASGGNEWVSKVEVLK